MKRSRYAACAALIALGIAVGIADAAGGGSGYVFQGPVLAASGEAGAGAFGSSTAISADGSVLLVGARADNPTGAPQSHEAGAAFFFTRSGSTWSQTQEVAAGDPTVSFGQSVSLSCDGSTALVGGFLGPFRVYTRIGSTWSQSSTIQPPDESGPADLSCDGNTIVIGGSGGSSQVAWVYGRSGTTWALSATLRMADVANTYVESVALSGDGSTALLGLPSFSPSTTDGVAYVFGRGAGGWQREATLRNTSPQPVQPDSHSQLLDTQFGHSVALSADGATALVSAPFDAPFTAAQPTGSVFVFVRSTAGTWALDGPKLTGSKTASPFVAGTAATAPFTNDLGWSVDLSADGRTAVLGSVSGTYAGGAAQTATIAPVVYVRAGSQWVQQLEPPLPAAAITGQPTNPLGANWPREVALSADGATIAYGAHDEDGGKGRILMFAYGELPTTGSGAGTGGEGPTTMCIVPNVLGRSVHAARAALRRAHCSTGRVTSRRARGKAGSVVSQSPRPATRLAAGTAVALVVARRR